MKSWFLSCIYFVPILSLTGCATIFHGSYDKISFSSNPTGANIFINGDSLGATPMNITLKSNRVYNIECRKAGYKKQSFIVTRSVGFGWIILDIVCGLFPVFIDSTTECWYSLDQEHIDFILEK